MEVIGKKRHFFGRPGLKAVNQVGAKFSNPLTPGGEFQAELPRENLMLNPEVANALKQIAGSQKNLRSQLES